MRQIAKAVVSIAAVSTALLVAGCGSDSDSAAAPTTPSSTAASAAAASGQAKPALSGDTYKDTCSATLIYINQMIDTGLAAPGTTRESLGKDSLDAVKKSTQWSTMDGSAQKDYQRGVEAAVKGKC